jgi:hypothetical protein
MQEFLTCPYIPVPALPSVGSVNLQFAPQSTRLYNQRKEKMEEQQLEHLGQAIIGLCMMCLSTTLFHIYTSSKFWNPDKPRTEQEGGLFLWRHSCFSRL